VVQQGALAPFPFVFLVFFFSCVPLLRAIRSGTLRSSLRCAAYCGQELLARKQRF
jgi:hypothetical protein